jgi:hypothetical protein
MRREHGSNHEPETGETNMDSKSLEKLKFDLRLASRPGWISNDAMAAEMEKLPDAADKLVRVEPSGGGEDGTSE